MGRPRKEPQTEIEKLAAKIGDDGESVVQELEAADVEELNKRIAQANQAIATVKEELEENENYQQVCRDKKYLSSGLSAAKKRQNAIIAVAVKFRQEKGAI